MVKLTLHGRGLFALSILMLLGCASHPPLLPEPARPAVMPSYEEIAARYNQRAGLLDQLWARTGVELRWVEKGKKKFEQGEGHLMWLTPDRVAVTVGKLGQTLYWAGCDHQRYWLFDLREPSLAYVGKREHWGKPCSEPLPQGVEVAPTQLPRLLGWLPVPEQSEPGLTLDWAKGGYVIEHRPQAWRMKLDATTLLPTRVDLLDARGFSHTYAQLSQPVTLAQDDEAEAEPVVIMSRAVVEVVARRGSLTLHLKDVSDGRENQRIRPRQFDFEALQQLHQPQMLRRLDAGCE